MSSQNYEESKLGSKEGYLPSVGVLDIFSYFKGTPY